MVILAPLVPPKFVYDVESLPFALFRFGFGYGKHMVGYSINAFIKMYFIMVRIILVYRIFTRYTKFRSFRAEIILKSYQIYTKLECSVFAMKAMCLREEFRLPILMFSALCAFFSITNYILEQPFYIGKSYKDWLGFQDYNSIYPAVSNTIQVLTQNVSVRAFY